MAGINVYQTLLDQELRLAKDDILILGSIVEQAILDSVRALKEHDLEKSKTIFENDKVINSSMSLESVDMLHRSLTAFLLEDADLAKVVIDEDELVDALYDQLYHQVLGSVVEDPGNIERVNYVLWVGHNLERVADRVTNICERVIFTATGRMGEISTRYTAFTYQAHDA